MEVKRFFKFPEITKPRNPLTPEGMKALLLVLAVIILLSGIGFVAIKGVELTKKRVPQLSPSPAAKVLPAATEVTPTASPTLVPITPTEVIPSPTKGATPSAQRLEVTISSFAFQPTNITTGRGSIIVWTNKDTVVHTVTAFNGSFDSGVIDPGDSFVQKFDKVKSYLYSCTFHPEEKGTITIQ